MEYDVFAVDFLVLYYIMFLDYQNFKQFFWRIMMTILRKDQMIPMEWLSELSPVQWSLQHVKSKSQQSPISEYLEVLVTQL